MNERRESGDVPGLERQQRLAGAAGDDALGFLRRKQIRGGVLRQEEMIDGGKRCNVLPVWRFRKPAFGHREKS
jgi:hypothetical protein